jgi:hypothetical protein
VSNEQLAMSNENWFKEWAHFRRGSAGNRAFRCNSSLLPTVTPAGFPLQSLARGKKKLTVNSEYANNLITLNIKKYK